MNSILSTMGCHTLAPSGVWVTFASSKLTQTSLMQFSKLVSSELNEDTVCPKLPSLLMRWWSRSHHLGFPFEKPWMMVLNYKVRMKNLTHMLYTMRDFSTGCSTVLITGTIITLKFLITVHIFLPISQKLGVIPLICWVFKLILKAKQYQIIHFYKQYEREFSIYRCCTVINDF